MATYERWSIRPDWQSPIAEERYGGVVRRYHPDFLMESCNRPSPDALEVAHDAEVLLAKFGERAKRRPLPLLHATLLKSESISSSLIEGYQTPVRDVLMAEFEPSIAGSVAVTINRNIETLKTALATLNGEWTSALVDGVHSTLMPGMKPGFRTEQVRVGGRSLFRAAYVPPPCDEVPALVDDLVEYANRGRESTVVKAALVHAQFETIHPYADGNGRTGRAVVHALLQRSGLTGTVVPVSTVLKVRADEYVQALGRYRYDPEAGESRQDAVDWFVNVFSAALHDSVMLADKVYDDVEELELIWREKMAGIRADSVAHAVVASLADRPVVVIDEVAAKNGVTRAAASRAVGRLESLGILEKASGKYKRASVFMAPDMLNLVTDAERRQASPAMDTVLAAPVLLAPGPTGQFSLMCDAWMPRAATTCVLSKGHRGPHKSKR